MLRRSRTVLILWVLVAILIARRPFYQGEFERWLLPDETSAAPGIAVGVESDIQVVRLG
jgi:hypothetical protein